MGTNGAGYITMLVLHILCAIIGFGAVMLNGFYAIEARDRKGPEGLAISEANHKVTMIGLIFMLLVPVFGLAMIGMSHSQWKFSQTWLEAAIPLYVAAMVVALAVHLPNVNRIIGLQRELVAATPGAGGPPPQLSELEARGKRAAAMGGFLNLAVIAIVMLMVWKPGAPIH